MTYVPDHWTIIQARGGAEAKAVECLQDHGVSAYCPMERLWAPSREPYTRTKERALIAGYIFADLPEGLALSQITGPGAMAIYGLLMVNGRVATVRRQALGYLIALEHFGHFDHTLATRARRRKKYAKGERVQVVDGHLKGAVGEIMKAPKGDRLQILISFGRGGAQRVMVPASQVAEIEAA
jgi:transcription antitermination factor NusG